MKDIKEACDKIRDYLSNWYTDKVLSLNDNKKYLDGWDLWDAKQEFITLNPEYKKYNFHIITAYDVDGTDWIPRRFCSNGCCSFDDCSARMKCRGILVMPRDWEITRALAKGA